MRQQLKLDVIDPAVTARAGARLLERDRSMVYGDRNRLDQEKAGEVARPPQRAGKARDSLMESIFLNTCVLVVSTRLEVEQKTMRVAN